MNKGFKTAIDHYSPTHNTLPSDSIRVRLSYQYKWRQSIEKSAAPVINGENDEKVTPYAFSATGVVTEVGMNVADIFPGAYVAVVGVADASDASIEVVSDKTAVRIIPKGVSAKNAALSGLGAFYMNVIKAAHMPEGSVCYVVAQDDACIVDLLMCCGYSLANNLQSADYIFTSESDNVDLQAAQKNVAIVLLGDNACCLNNDVPFTCFHITMPGADWCDARVHSNKVVYPHAYIHNTVADNVSTFLQLLSHDRISLNNWPQPLPVSNDIEDKVIIEDIVNTLDDSLKSLLGSKAKAFSERRKPAIGSLCIPAGQNQEDDLDQAVQMADKLIGFMQTSRVELSKNVITLGYSDGSVITVQTLPKQAKRHIELHWEGNSLAI